MGFSDADGDSYTRMTAATVDDVELPSDPERGPTALDDYIRARPRTQLTRGGGSAPSTTLVVRS